MLNLKIDICEYVHSYETYIQVCISSCASDRITVQLYNRTTLLNNLVAQSIKGISRPIHPSFHHSIIPAPSISQRTRSLIQETRNPPNSTIPITSSSYIYTHTPHIPRFLLPNLIRSPSPARLFHSSVSRRTPSRYILASSLPSTRSPGQCPERRRCLFKFSQRQSGLKVQPGWGHR